MLLTYRPKHRLIFPQTYLNYSTFLNYKYFVLLFIEFIGTVCNVHQNILINILPLRTYFTKHVLHDSGVPNRKRKGVLVDCCCFWWPPLAERRGRSEVLPEPTSISLTPGLPQVNCKLSPGEYRVHRELSGGGLGRSQVCYAFMQFDGNFVYAALQIGKLGLHTFAHLAITFCY